MHESEKWKWSRSVVSDSSDTMDCSPPGSSVHGIFQAKVLEWGAIEKAVKTYSLHTYSVSGTVWSLGTQGQAKNRLSTCPQGTCSLMRRETLFESSLRAAADLSCDQCYEGRKGYMVLCEYVWCICRNVFQRSDHWTKTIEAQNWKEDLKVVLFQLLETCRLNLFKTIPTRV